ncbi:MAG: hypothetical protein M1816_006836 [Peltula sp. TS41687]|nr:MAG: hypothetical protein M1816_006836 [Peltula sp. TS41687]
MTSIASGIVSFTLTIATVTTISTKKVTVPAGRSTIPTIAFPAQPTSNEQLPASGDNGPSSPTPTESTSPEGNGSPSPTEPASPVVNEPSSAPDGGSLPRGPNGPTSSTESETGSPDVNGPSPPKVTESTRGSGDGSGAGNPGAQGSMSPPFVPKNEVSGSGEVSPLTPVTVGGATLLVGPSQAIIASTTFSIGPDTPPTTVVIDSQTISIGPRGIGFESTTVALPSRDSGSAFSSVITAGGVTFAANPTAVVIDGSTTYQVGEGATPTTAVINGQIVSFGSEGVGLASTMIVIPPTVGRPPSSTVTAGGLTLVMNPTEAVIGGTTYPIGSGARMPTTAVINGQTVSLGPDGIGLPTTTIPVPGHRRGVQQSVMTAGGIGITINPTEAIINGTTYPIGSAAKTPTTAVINGQTVSLGPDGIELPTTTVPVPNQTAGAQPLIITAGGLTFSVNPTEAVISGTTYPIGSGATMPITTVINGQTVSFGPGGVGLPTTTVPVPEQTGGARQSVITAGGIGITINPSEAIVSGTTYPIGSAGSIPTTTVIKGQTVSFGPGGIGLPTTIIMTPSTGTIGAGTGGVQPFTGSGGRTLGTAAGKERVVCIFLALALGGLI